MSPRRSITRSGGPHGRRPRRRSAPQGAHRRRGLGCRRAARPGPPAVRHADGRLPRPARPRDDPDLRRPRRPRRRRVGRRGRAAAGARATSTSGPPRTATRPRRSTPSRPPRCATRSSAPTPCSTSGASRWRSSRARAWRSTAACGSTSACRRPRLLPAALVAPERRMIVAAVCGARPLAEGRPPMGIVCAQQDVARVYPLPDDPERCLEDFLARRRRARARDGRAPRSSGGLGRALPRALGRRLPRDRLARSARCAAVRRARVLIPVAFGVFVFARHRRCCWPAG